MHIPDGYLSPQTTIPAFAVMGIVWYLALSKLKNINQLQTPFIALCAAFSFVIMMFNVPITGGSSAHAVGGVLVAILVGPWAAVIVLSTTLAIQAFLFGDGGILSLGVNCLNMAFIMPFAGYIVYSIIKNNQQSISSKRNLCAVFLASFVGVNCAAFAAALEMGIQPLLFKTATGVPLYGFYGLNITIPAMMVSHLLVVGPLEGVISLITMSYVSKFAPQIVSTHLVANKPQYSRLVVGIVVLVLLTPLGLLASGTAFGEWSNEEVKGLIGYVPDGLQTGSNLWHAIMPDYSFHIFENNHLQPFSYIISAFIGVVAVSILILISARITSKVNKS